MSTKIDGLRIEIMYSPRIVNQVMVNQDELAVKVLEEIIKELKNNALPYNANNRGYKLYFDGSTVYRVDRLSIQMRD